MLVLYETAAGYALFKMSDKGKLEERDMFDDFKTPEVCRCLDACLVPFCPCVCLSVYMVVSMAMLINTFWSVLLRHVDDE
jgi:hypothetical protein